MVLLSSEAAAGTTIRNWQHRSRRSHGSVPFATELCISTSPTARSNRADSRPVSAAASPARRCRKTLLRRDDAWFCAAAAAVLALGCYWAFSSIRQTVVDALSGGSAQPCVVSVTVKPGDTLWRLAGIYGAPGSYILDRVDSIARENGLIATASLTPGQHLRINVENPVLLARLQQDQRVASGPTRTVTMPRKVAED
jgi:hypothetical protein